ncbi:hypothetical protein F4801DRAFT_428030 [Xylaria longipes]|nr:hypothetical protein F4801DRAFT_428030 [Xylaria longipes]
MQKFLEKFCWLVGRLGLLVQCLALDTTSVRHRNVSPINREPRTRPLYVPLAPSWHQLPLRRRRVEGLRETMMFPSNSI